MTRIPPTSHASLTAADYARVHVGLASGGDLGTAAEVLRSKKLSAAERAAIEALVHAVALLGARVGYQGFDDARGAVKLLLRDSDALTGGPWATTGAISVGTSNALAARSPQRARPDALLPVDVAIHELTHVIQFAHMPADATPHGGIVEGIADSAAILATGDDTLGEGMYKNGADGKPLGSVRELGAHRTSGPPLGKVIKSYAEASAPGAEEHAAGGVVSATFIALRGRIGREAAERILWVVIRDRAAWQSGGSWGELARALRRAAGNDSATLAAIDAALAATGLNAALKAR